MNIIEKHNLIERVACYLRVSTQEQKLRGLSPEAQREALKRYAEEHNLKIVEWYEDLGVSGRKLIKKRPALQKMIQDAEQGNFDRIIFIKLDRYFRSVAEYYECQKRLDAKNVKWTATEEKYDLTTASGRYWVTQKLAMAEYEADQTGERIDLVNEYKIKTGQPLVGDQSLGIAFTVEKDENGIKKVVQDPKTKELVLDYINYFLIHKNKSQAHLYINNKYGTAYSYNSLSKILTDTKIYGHYRGNDNYCKGYITKEIWDKVQSALQDNIKLTPSKRAYVFSGLLVCPLCGRKLSGNYTYGQSIKKRGKTYNYNREYYHYRCNRHIIDKVCDYNKRVSESKIEKALLENFNKFMNVYINEAEVTDAREKDNCINEKIAQTKGEMTRLNNMYQKGRKTESEYDKEYEALELHLKELESHLEPIVERDLTVYKELLKSDWIDIYNKLNRENKRAFWHKYIKAIIPSADSGIKDIIFF